MISGTLCPLSGRPGAIRRTYSGAELSRLYETYFGVTVPSDVAGEYFNAAISQYECRETGLRWYAPAKMGGSEYYEWLADTFPWYYADETWDKRVALDCLRAAGCRTFLEPGCGGGHFLQMAARAGIHGTGIEINESAIAACREAGLRVYSPTEREPQLDGFDALVSLQTLEHVPDPVAFLAEQTSARAIPLVIVAVPCHETLLGRTSDPLSWPPHHYTSWSRRALEHLARRIGYAVREVYYQPLSFTQLMERTRREVDGRIAGVPQLPNSRLGRATFRLLQKCGVHWASRAHSILVTMRRG